MAGRGFIAGRRRVAGRGFIAGRRRVARGGKIACALHGACTIAAACACEVASTGLHARGIAALRTGCIGCVGAGGGAGAIAATGASAGQVACTGLQGGMEACAIAALGASSIAALGASSIAGREGRAHASAAGGIGAPPARQGGGAGRKAGAARPTATALHCHAAAHSLQHCQGQRRDKGSAGRPRCHSAHGSRAAARNSVGHGNGPHAVLEGAWGRGRALSASLRQQARGAVQHHARGGLHNAHNPCAAAAAARRGCH